MMKRKVCLVYCIFGTVTTFAAMVAAVLFKESWRDYMYGVATVVLAIMSVGWLHELKTQLKGDKDNA